MEYNRVIYPERAEYLNESIFKGYRIVLDHWKPMIATIKSHIEEAILRRVSKTLVVYGNQSTGKTLLGNKLTTDFAITQEEIRDSGKVNYQQHNIWHQIAGGFGKNTDLIVRTSNQAVILHIEDDHQWIEKAKSFCGQNSSKTCIIIADNCERDYFVQSLCGMSDEEYLKIGRSEALIKRAAQRFVALCRKELQGAATIMFTNDDIFALSFEEAVNQQHKDLVQTTTMVLPPKQEMETVVRINTNRLNPFSYWYCLDRAGISEKRKAYSAISLSTSYKDCFDAIDSALKKAGAARIGRPPTKCLLTLFCLTDSNDVTGLVEGLGIDNEQETIDKNPLIAIRTYKEGWTKILSISGSREASLLESEWNFRIVVAGNQFTDYLFSSQDKSIIKDVIQMATTNHGTGTWQSTRETYKAEFTSKLANIPAQQNDLNQFWALGQRRSIEYEKILAGFLPNYNNTSTGFLSYRPDYVISAYTPCQLMNSASDSEDNINDTIKRRANTCEFTSLKVFSLQTVVGYLEGKIQNYINILQEQ